MLDFWKKRTSKEYIMRGTVACPPNVTVVYSPQSVVFVAPATGCRHRDDYYNPHLLLLLLLLPPPLNYRRHP